MRESDFVIDHYDEPPPPDWEPDEVDPFVFFAGSYREPDPRQTPKADVAESYNGDDPPW